jgi:acyl carrier protein
MAKKVNFEKVRADVKKLVAEIVEIPEKDLKEDARFAEELGVDSMKALEIVSSIEKKLKVRIPEQKIPTIQSLNNIYEILNKILKK